MTGALEPGLDAFDDYDVRRATRAEGLVAEFNAAGVLAPADVHVASTVGRLCGESDNEVLLAAALAVRAPRIGHVCTDLATVSATATVEADVPVDVSALPWPAVDRWLAAVSASPMVAVGSTGGNDRPLRLIGSLLYLDRYWREEQLVAAEVAARSVEAVPGVEPPVLAEGLTRLFARVNAAAEVASPDLQRAAAAVAVLRGFSVVGGGPGTGKTTTVARILALLLEQAEVAGEPLPRIALAAPTGKAAARLSEAVHDAAHELDVSELVRERLLVAEASTLHRLLGWMPGNRSRFRHHRGNRLPHDVVVVDESSMVALSLMAKLLDAVRRDARVVLVGDPDQLASVEAGAVLGDVVGPARSGLLMTPAAASAVAAATGETLPVQEPPAGAVVADGIVVLRHVHRYEKGSGLEVFAEAVQRGDADGAVGALRDGRHDLRWIEADAADASASSFDPLRASVVAAGSRLVAAAQAGDGASALQVLGDFRLLCAHRRGSYGVDHWKQRVEAWLVAGVDGLSLDTHWYVGRPLLVTSNDYALQLFNGDTGVIVNAGAGRVAAVFERRGEPVEFSPTLLSSVETVHAMTVHKSQGSQFTSVALLLPEEASPILTRELLYTGATRARRDLTIIGEEASVRAAVSTPISRASGLRSTLWGDSA